MAEGYVPALPEAPSRAKGGLAVESEAIIALCIAQQQLLGDPHAKVIMQLPGHSTAKRQRFLGKLGGPLGDVLGPNGPDHTEVAFDAQALIDFVCKVYGQAKPAPVISSAGVSVKLKDESWTPPKETQAVVDQMLADVVAEQVAAKDPDAPILYKFPGRTTSKRRRLFGKLGGPLGFVVSRVGNHEIVRFIASEVSAYLVHYSVEQKAAAAEPEELVDLLQAAIKLAADIVPSGRPMTVIHLQRKLRIGHDQALHLYGVLQERGLLNPAPPTPQPRLFTETTPTPTSRFRRLELDFDQDP